MILRQEAGKRKGSVRILPKNPRIASPNEPHVRTFPAGQVVHTKAPFIIVTPLPFPHLGLSISSSSCPVPPRAVNRSITAIASWDLQIIAPTISKQNKQRLWEPKTFSFSSFSSLFFTKFEFVRPETVCFSIPLFFLLQICQL